MIGVKAGDGMGVGISRIGLKHLLMFDGISSKIDGGFSRLLLLPLLLLADDDLCAEYESMTGTSMDVLCIWYETGESGAQLVKLTGVCMDDVDDSSSPPSCGLDADGVVDGDIIIDDGMCDITLVDAKFRNMANMESALDTFGFMRRFRRNAKSSFNVCSDPDRESLPWLDDVLWGDRISWVHDGVGGTELGRGIGSVGACKRNEANVCVPCELEILTNNQRTAYKSQEQERIRIKKGMVQMRIDMESEGCERCEWSHTDMRIEEKFLVLVNDNLILNLQFQHQPLIRNSFRPILCS